MSLELEQIVLILIIGGAILLVVALTIWLRYRRRKRVSLKVLGVDLESFRSKNPCFHSVMKAVQERGLEDVLGRRGDVRAAFKLLGEQSLLEQARKKKDRRASLLDVPVPTDRRIDAAIMTVLRAVYMDEGTRRALTAEALAEMDQFLDSLTG